MNRLQNIFNNEHPVAFITGSGAPRVGQVIAKHLATLGCHIALHANQSIEGANNAAKDIKERYGNECIVVQGALEDPTRAETIVQDVVQQFGRIDILVNSAAIWHPTRLEDVTTEELMQYYQINTLACWLTSRAAGLTMSQQDSGGCIINLGDWATERPYLDHAAYFPSKGGVDTMTRSLAVELGHRNPKIRVNCIKPGPVLLADEVDPEERKKIADSTLVKRVGTAEHIAHAVQFLCENDFMTGSLIAVDGGRSIFAPDGLQVGMNTG